MNQEEMWLLQEKYDGEKSNAFFADCERLAGGEPLAYIIGWVPFLDCKIYLSSNLDQDPPTPSSNRHQGFLSGDRTGIKAKKFALIPRPETEFWTAKAIEEIGRSQADTPHVLDLCAGSGCIGIAVKKALPHVDLSLAEIDESHHMTITKNCHQNQVQDAHIFGGDLFEIVEHKSEFILANPPYIDPALDRTEASVKKYEPTKALYGGRDGIEVIERIIATAPAYLTQGGQLWIEHEPEQSQTISTLAQKSGFSVTTHTDQFGIERFSVLQQQ